MLSTTLKKIAVDKLGDLVVAGIAVVALPPLLYIKAIVVTCATVVNTVEQLLTVLDGDTTNV